MPSSVNDLVRSLDLGPGGMVPWGHEVPSSQPGVYLVALVGYADAIALLDHPPLSVSAVANLGAAGFTLDGEPADALTLTRRLAQMWLPDESVLYIGKTNSLRRRAYEYHRSLAHRRSPHTGGWPIRTLEPDGLWVFWFECVDPEAAESEMLKRFVTSVSEQTKLRLIDPEHPYPFANLTGPHGPKGHGIGRPPRGTGGEGGLGGVRVPRRPPPTAGGGTTAVRALVEELVGEELRTLAQQKLNWITRVDHENVWVETERSRREDAGPQALPIRWLEDAYRILMDTGILRREDLGARDSKRSAFIFAALARLPGVDVSVSPIELRLLPTGER